MVNYQNVNLFVEALNLKTRPNAGPGLWLMFLLPSCLIVSLVRHSIVATHNYKLSSIFSIGLICTSLQIIYRSSNNKRVHILDLLLISSTILTTVLFRICLHRDLSFCLWSGVFSTICYQKLYLYILKKLPRCFTLGEAAFCCQGYVIFLYFTIGNIFNNINESASGAVQISTLIIQLGLFGIASIAFLVHTFQIKSPTKFYSVTFLVSIFIVLLPLHILLGQSALVFIGSLIYEDWCTRKIVPYWAVCSILAAFAVDRQIKTAQKASTSVRKTFHFLSLAVFIPGLIYNCVFVYLASAVALGVFFALEILRIAQIPPFAKSLEDGFAVFGDAKDAGAIAFTPIYLLAACALPLWIHPAPCDVTNSAIFNLMPLLSGLLTIGVGDAAASIVGSNYGKHFWRGSKKTIEGTVACVASQVFMIYLLIYLDFLKPFTVIDFIKVATAILVTSTVEAKTDQVDNLVLPLIMYLILI